jgi:hypothetical protein
VAPITAPQIKRFHPLAVVAGERVALTPGRPVEFGIKVPGATRNGEVSGRVAERRNHRNPRREFVCVIADQENAGGSKIFVVRERQFDGGRGIKRVDAQSGSCAVGVMFPGGARAYVDTVTFVSFRGEDVREQPVAAPTCIFRNPNSRNTIKNLQHPISRNPPGGRGQLAHGLSSPSVVWGEWEGSPNVSFQSSIRKVAIPMSYQKKRGIFDAWMHTHTGSKKSIPQKRA